MLDSSNYTEDYILGAVSKNYVDYPQQITVDSSGTSTVYYQMCTMEEIVDKFMSWSPEIVNEYNTSTGYVMHYDSSAYNPTYVQIKNSTSLSVTLFKGMEISGYKWKYKEGSLSCTTSGKNKIIDEIADSIDDKILFADSAVPDYNSAQVVTVDFLTPEEVASKLSREYPPSKYSMTSGTRTFTITGRLKVTFFIKPGGNNLNPEGNYDFYSEPYYGIIDNYDNRSTDKCPFTAEFEVVPVYNYIDGTTYKFNGEIGQFPKLKLVGQYEEDEELEDEFTKKYTSKSLVRLKDILGIYNNKKITFRFYNFKLKDGMEMRISSNCELYSSMLISNPQEYVYTMTSGTSFEFTISSSQVFNYDDYENFNIRYKDKSDAFIIDSSKIIDNISQDIIIEITANYKKKNCVYISAEEPMQVINSSTKEVIMEEGMTYATVFTDYAHNDEVNLKISSSRAIKDYSHYRYAISYFIDGKMDLHYPQSGDPSALFPTNGPSYYEIEWTENSSFVNEEGVTCYYFDKTIDKLNSHDSVYLWLDMKEAFRPHTITFTLHCSVALVVEGIEVIQKGSDIKSYTFTTTESKQSITFTCRDLPEDTQTKGWFYRTGANNSSAVFSSGENTKVSALNSDVNVSIYLSTVNVATWVLDASSGARVYDNFSERVLSNGTYHTTPDINNTKIDLTINRNNLIFGNDFPIFRPFILGATIPGTTIPGVTIPGQTFPGVITPGITIPNRFENNHNRFDYVWKKYFGNAEIDKDEKTGLDLVSGYRFQKNNLSTAEGYSYKLTIKTYKNYVTKNVILDIKNNQQVSSSIKSISGTTIDTKGDPEQINDSGVTGVRYKYTLSSGTKVGFELSIDKFLLAKYPYMKGRVTTYIDPNSVKTWKDLPQMNFDSEGKYVLEYDFSVFEQFNDAEYVIFELNTVTTRVYNYFVKGDGKVTLGVFNGDMSDPSNVTLLPKTIEAHPLYTTYEHPTQFKIKIMCDEENIYSSYSYRYYDNKNPFVSISEGVKKFNEYTYNNQHYSTFSPSENDLTTYEDGTVLSITAIYDSILYRRFVKKPFMVTKRKFGSRPVFVRTD